MNYFVCPCTLCNRPMTLRQLHECVYWLPDLTDHELRYISLFGEEPAFKQAHRHCWKRLSEKQRAKIRFLSFEKNTPRSMGQLV